MAFIPQLPKMVRCWKCNEQNQEHWTICWKCRAVLRRDD